MYSYSQWLEDYRARWRSIVTLVDEIPLIDEQAIEDMVSGKDLYSGHVFGHRWLLLRYENCPVAVQRKIKLRFLIISSDKVKI